MGFRVKELSYSFAEWVKNIIDIFGIETLEMFCMIVWALWKARNEFAFQ